MHIIHYIFFFLSIAYHISIILIKTILTLLLFHKFIFTGGQLGAAGKAHRKRVLNVKSDLLQTIDAQIESMVQSNPGGYGNGNAEDNGHGLALSGSQAGLNNSNGKRTGLGITEKGSESSFKSLGYERIRVIRVESCLEICSAVACSILLLSCSIFSGALGSQPLSSSIIILHDSNIISHSIILISIP